MKLLTKILAAFSGKRQCSCSADPIKENCHNCKFGGVYECRRHAPIHNPDGLKPIWPQIYNQGLGEWCGDWEPNAEHDTRH